MKTFSLFLATFVISLGTSVAQSIDEPIPPAERIREMLRKNTERLTKELMLSEQQIQEVAKINDEFAVEIIRINEQRRQAAQKREQALKKTLTEEQYSKLEESRADKRKELRSRKRR